MSGLYGNPCVPEQSSSTSNRYEKTSHRALADMLGRIRTPVKGANIKGDSLGNQLRRKAILPPFRMFYSLGLVPPLRGVDRLLKLTPYLPVAFHGILPAEKSQREHTRI